MRLANVRPHGGHGSPSWSRWSTAASAHPGEAASATAEAGSGTSRVSPVGPSIPGDEVMPSLTRKTENTFDRPTPNRATSSNRRIGMHFTRVIPAGSTIASATASTPGRRQAPRHRHGSAARAPGGSRARRS
jgi:hypothetical protein